MIVSSEYQLKNRIISRALKILTLMGFIAYIPSMYLSVKEGVWVVAGLDTACLAYLYIIAYWKKVPYHLKVYSIDIMSYLLGAVLLIYTGPFGAGIIYLFGFLFINALFFSPRLTIMANTLAFLTFTVYIILDYFDILKWEYPIWALIVILGNFAFVGSMLSAGISYLMRGLREQIELQQKLQDQLKIEISAKDQEKKRAEEALKAKSFLLREMHHRIKNNLQVITSLINLHLNRKSGDKDCLIGVRDRVNAISLVHRLLYSDDTTDRVELTSLLDTILENILSSMHTEGITFEKEIKVSDIQISMDRATLISLIVNEILMNSVKHAFPGRNEGRIKITIDRQGVLLCLTISDNGIGFSGTKDTERKHLGLVIIDALTSQLKAEYTVSQENGTCYEIYIPLL